MLKLLGAVAVLVVIAAGCGSDDPQRSAASEPTATPTVSAREPAAAAPTWDPEHSDAVRNYYGGGDGPPAIDGDIEAEYHQHPRPATGGIGDTITLTSTNIGVRLRVTVTRLVDPVRTTESPRAGMRYVGVGLRLRNTGVAIHYSRLKSAFLRHGAGPPAPPVFGVKARCSNGFEGIVAIDDSAPARGCLLFQIPDSARPRELMLALEELPAEVGGRWRLR
jgi:hypothetical protein